MQLKSLEIQGFKSFPDKTRLEFTPGITAVVGPNGSGKSNLVDAVRWVFGEQSSKTLRAGKMEEVIFGGTQSRRAQGYASVTLTIDNRDRTLGMDADEVIVCRRLYRSGESEYRLGNTAVRLKDVYELFLDTGLGRDGYSIIGQGKIAEIVSSKSSERREIFEEAAGIAKFRYRKGEAERRLALAEDNLLRLRDILLELEGRVEPLRREAEKARVYLGLSAEKRELEVSVWVHSLEKLRRNLREQEDNYLTVGADHRQREEAAAALEEAISALFEEMQRCTVAAETLRQRIRGEEEALAQSQADAAVCRNDLSHNRQTVADLDGELAGDHTAGAALTDEIARWGAEEAAHRAEAARLQAEAAGKQTALAEQSALAGELQAEADNLRQHRSTLYQRLDEARLAGATTRSRLEEAQARLEQLGDSAQGRTAALEKLERERTGCRELQAAIGKKLEALAAGREELAARQREILAEREALLDRERTLLGQAGERRQKAGLLGEMEKSLEGYAASVRYLLGQGERGRLRGIRGPVSRLISTDAAHSTAIETALGGAMQNIVVEDEEAAKAAIRLLQSSKQGRATFLPLTSVKGSPIREQGLEQFPGFVGLASALVSYDPAYDGIVQWLLGRTVVAKDLDSAVAMAKRLGYRHRVVTLDGQQVNSGGSMTGGFAAKSAGLLGRQHEIARLEEEAEALRKEAAAYTARAGEESRKLALLAARLEELAAEERTAGEDAIRATGEERRLTLAIAEGERAWEQAQGEEAALRSRLEALRGQRGADHRLLLELEEALAAAEEAIAAAAAQREAYARQATTLGEEQARLELALLAAQKDAQAAALQVQGLRTQADHRQQRRRELEARREELLRQNAAIQERIETLEASEALYRQSVTEAQRRLGELSAQRERCEQEAGRQRAQSREISAQKENLARELARLEERKNTLQAEYDKVIARLWDEYELTRSQAEEIARPLQDSQAAQRRLQELRGRIKSLGHVNVGAPEEYREVSERYRFMKAQVEDVEQSRTELRRLIGELTGQMREVFSQNFTRISRNFSEIFTDLFGGGRASLTLTDEEDVLESGIDIFVEPPGKIIKSLASLSGGEQAFVAIAIYFAILRVNPSPFCLLDEIEAALDDVNVVRFASYLRRMTAKTQFIAITHRRGTMEEADVLYGVTMQEEGVSKLLELRVSEVEEKLAASVQ